MSQIHAIYAPVKHGFSSEFALNLTMFFPFLSLVRESPLFNLVAVGNSQMLVNYINPQKDYSKTTPGLFSGPIKQSIWLRLITMLKTMSKPLLISSFVTIICECENCFDR